MQRVKSVIDPASFIRELVRAEALARNRAVCGSVRSVAFGPRPTEHWCVVACCLSVVEASSASMVSHLSGLADYVKEDQARHEARYRDRAIKALHRRAQEFGLILSPQPVSTHA